MLLLKLSESVFHNLDEGVCLVDFVSCSSNLPFLLLILFLDLPVFVIYQCVVDRS